MCLARCKTLLKNARMIQSFIVRFPLFYPLSFHSVFYPALQSLPP
uniref:Uncharacterized protein n=1 Tax=Anguilla anguilla TaxID=7936 RepID=A0A0E9TZD4_ANGAN